MNIFIPINKKDLTPKQIKGILRALSVIKEKRDNALKSRTCAIGTPQREIYSKNEMASLTIHTDSFMVMTAIEAKEKCDMVIRDIKGVYLYAGQKDFTIIKFVNK